MVSVTPSPVCSVSFAMTKYAQEILFFFCRPCGEYHEKTHPHYAEQQARAAERRAKKAESQTKKKGKKRG
jgi:hypothetical protein